MADTVEATETETYEVPVIESKDMISRQCS